MRKEWKDLKSFDALCQTVNKELKGNAITTGMADYCRDRIPFTSIMMNYCTHGGLPVYQASEFRGLQYSGKTTTALDIVANYQADERLSSDGEVLYIDVENRLDEMWAKTLGVDTDKLKVFAPAGQSAEYILEFAQKAIETGELGLVIIDSIAALFSEKEYEISLEDFAYAGVSKPLTRFSKFMLGDLPKYKTTLIGINQPKPILNSPCGGTYTPGGNFWKHACTVILEFKQGEYIDANGKDIGRNADETAGNRIIMSTVKNSSCAPNHRTGSYTVRSDSGIDLTADIIDFGFKFDIIQGTSWLTIIDVETGEVLSDKVHGKGELYSLLTEDTQLRENVLAQIYKNI